MGTVCKIRYLGFVPLENTVAGIAMHSEPLGQLAFDEFPENTLFCTLSHEIEESCHAPLIGWLLCLQSGEFAGSLAGYGRPFGAEYGRSIDGAGHHSTSGQSRSIRGHGRPRDNHGRCRGYGSLVRGYGSPNRRRRSTRRGHYDRGG